MVVAACLVVGATTGPASAQRAQRRLMVARPVRIGRSLAARFASPVGALDLPRMHVGTSSSVRAATAGVSPWSELPPMKTARFAMAGGIDESVAPHLEPFVAGGANTQLLATGQEYSPEVNVWSSQFPVQPSYGAASTTSLNPDPSFGYATYILGGFNPNTGRVWAHATVLDMLRLMYDDLPNLPVARAFLGAAYGPDQRVYAVGGLGSTGAVSATEVFDKTTQAWVGLASMPTPRYGLGVATAGTKLYAIGGYRPGVGDLPTVEAYDPSTDTWSTAAPMPDARSLLSAVTGPDGKIYAIGGVQGNSYLRRVDVYDPTTDSWSCTTPMPTPRAAFIATSANGVIYAAGGRNAAGATNVFEKYDMTTPADGNAPTFARVPTVGFATGTQLGTVSVPVHLRYGASDAETDIRRYDLTVSTNGAAPTPVTLPWDAFSNGSYQYAATATDCAGNTSAASAGALFHVHAAQESSGVKYSTGWHSGASSTYYGGHDRCTTLKGAKAGRKFTGTEVAWVATKSPKRGAADVYLDGKLVAKVNLHSSTTIPRDIVFHHAWTTSGTHTIRIVNLATSGHPRIDIDAFAVLG